MKARSAHQILAIYLTDQWNFPVISRYELAVLVTRLYSRKRLGGLTLQGLRKPVAEVRDLSRLTRKLLNNGILTMHRDFPSGRIYAIAGKPKSDPVEVLCSADPFLYASHLTAMYHHGLTDRIPTTVFVTIPAPILWRAQAKEKEQSDLGDDLLNFINWGFPRLQRFNVQKIGNAPVHYYSSSDRGGYVVIQKTARRIASIGQTFLDMLRDPRLCGGIGHVVDVWQEHAPQFLDRIATEIERKGTKIEKVRAGYLFDEVCHVTSPLIESWAQHIQRGGSRKLDPNAPYDGTSYSAKWCISINS